MITIKNQSNTVIIVIHEIYGVNQHMKSIAQMLSEQGFDIICPNLLDQKHPYDYDQEELAYQNFMDNINIAAASRKIKSLVDEVKDQYRKIFLVGFSVGATIAWLCCADKRIDGIVGYYGSRIRDYTDLSPQCPAMLIIPEKEYSFNVDELIGLLNKNTNIEIHKLNGLHGFSDPYSPKYNEESAQKAELEMIRFLKEQI